MRILLTAVLFLSTAAAAQTIYRWTDKRGEVHYTDDPSSLPAGAKLETTEGEELMVVPAAKVPPPSIARPASPRPTRDGGVPAVSPQTGPIEVRLTRVDPQVELSEVDRKYVEEALQGAAASARLAVWGPLRQSVEVEITPAHKLKDEIFGLALGPGRMWLRAPKETHSQGRALPYEAAAVHELAHCLEHQIAGAARPRWFAEGFASYVAGDDRQASLDDIAWWVIHEGGATPLDRMFGVPGACPTGVAYAIARRAVVYLVELVGEAGIKGMFARRAAGAPFAAAFRDVSNLTVEEFQTRFIESLKPNYYERAR